MKALILSDLHPDMYFGYVIKPEELRGLTEKTEEMVYRTLDWMWNIYAVPATDAILIAGDLANDYLTFTSEINWLAGKYCEVYLCLGNHDLTVRGATSSKSNLQFTSSEQKIEKMKEHCAKFPNVHLLDGNVVNGIGGCMMTCDLKCDCAPNYDHRTEWKRKWYDGKHWRYMGQEPGLIWNDCKQKLDAIVAQKPKFILTHFAPYQVGVNFKHRLSNDNKFFYFNAEEWLEKLDHNTTWICGHTHTRKYCEYVNEQNELIKILCNPFGYPGEHDTYADKWCYKDGKLDRTSIDTTYDDYIVEI